MADKIKVAQLRPTQISVGMREVADKRRELAQESKDDRHDYLQHHVIPVVRGPGEGLFLIDHHHLARALWDDGFEHAWCEIIADLSAHPEAAFWHEMGRRHWVYPHDPHGGLRPCSALPAHVEKLRDDPYRSLAGYARNAGAYRKVEVPFAEFTWADFFRPRIRIEADDAGFEEALRKAIQLARSDEARQLPGYIG